MASPIQNEQSEKPGSAPAAPPRGDTSYIQAHGFNLGLITVVAWVANYLHITSFGLYEDDWFFLGFPFLVSFKDWMFGSMLEQFKRPYFQGRPLQNVFASVFAEAGALTHSLVVDYLIAYVLFAGSAVLMYEVLRRRFSTFLSTVAVLLFVLTPLHTLHQYLDLQFSFGPGFMLVFLAILLYQRGQQAWSYVLAVLSAFCYESIFFLFLGAPLLCSGPVFRGRRRAWLTHLGIFAALVACYFAGRRMLGETRVADLPGAWALVSVVAQSCVFHTFASFLTYLYAALRAHEATVEAWFYAALFLAAVLELFLRRSPRMVGRETATDRPLRDVLAHAGIGFAFIVCGYIVSYFVFKEPQPHFRFTDRDTRISAAASFGSSIFCAALLTAGVRLVRSRISRVLVFGACSVFLLVMFLYSFVLQQDYVEDWQEQRTEAAQVMTLTPDVERDSIIILELHVPGLPFFTSGSRRRAIGLEKTLYEYQFSNLYALGQPWPRLFVVYSDEWPHHLKLDPDGLMRWTEPVFNGRWYPASGDYRYRPGRFIVLEEQDPGWIVRHSDPILVDGQQIVQVMPADFRRVPLWASLRVTALSQAFLPGYAWKSALPETVPLGTDATLATDVVTFTWPRVSRAVDYWIDVGTAPAQGNIFGGFTKGKTEMTVSLAGHLTGETIYVQLYAKYPGIEFAAGTGAKFASRPSTISNRGLNNIMGEKPNHPENSRPFLTCRELVLILVLSAALTFYMWGPILQANWWIIDDYRWVNVIGNRTHLPFSEVLAQANPPDWHLGSLVNRPTYYAVTAVWMFLLGKNPSLWYFVKVVCFFGGLVGFWAATKHLLHLPVAGLLTLYIGLQPLWHEVVPPGVSELYAFLGCSLFLVGLSLLLQNGEIMLTKESALSRWRLYGAAACLTCGGVVAVGSKENFTILVMVATLVLLVIGIMRDQPKVLLGSYIVVLTWGAVVLNGIYRGVLRQGVDLYGHTIGERLAYLMQPLRFTNPTLILWLIYLLVVVISFFRPAFCGRFGLSRLVLAVAFGVQTFLCFAGVFLNCFYDGNIEQVTRYAFPYVLMPALSLALLYYLVWRACDCLSGRARALATLGGVVMVCFGIIGMDIGYNRRYATEYTRATQVFWGRLQKVIGAAQKDPGLPILFQSHGFNDFEPLQSVAIFLRSAGIRSPLYLDIMGYSEATARSHSEQYLLYLTRGQVGEGRRFSPVAEIPAGRHLTISFSKPELDQGVLANFWPLP